MKILNFNPSKEFIFDHSIPTHFFNSIDELLNQRIVKTEGEVNFKPLADVQETENHFLVEVQLPGLKKEQVNVEIIKNTLNIWGTKTRATEDEKTKFIKTESFDGNFKRSFKLSENIDKTNIIAKMENGVLSIELKKITPQIEKTEIVIQ